MTDSLLFPQAYDLLEEAIGRVLASYKLVDDVVERTNAVHDDKDPASQPRLRDLFSALRPDAELSDLVSEQWQDVGFQ